MSPNGVLFSQVVRCSGENMVAGVSRTAFIHNWDYHLIEIRIYADGMIDCWGLVDLAEFRRKVRDRWVVTQIPEGAMVRVASLGYFRAVDVWNDVREEDFIQEVVDLIDGLRGLPTTSDRCMIAWKRFQLRPSEENRSALREAYEAIPSHLRDAVLGDQDAKDFLIREAIYGPEGIPPESDGHSDGL